MKTIKATNKTKLVDNFKITYFDANGCMLGVEQCMSSYVPTYILAFGNYHTVKILCMTHRQSKKKSLLMESFAIDCTHLFINKDGSFTGFEVPLYY